MSGEVEASPEAPVATRRGRVGLEVGLVYLGTLLAIKGVVFAQRQLGLPPDTLIAVPLLFIYVPILVLRRQGRDPADLGMVIEEVRAALRLDATVWALIFPPFILLNHLYQGVIFGRGPSLRFPPDFLIDVVLYHLLYVALAEEFFYRGYMQSRLKEVWDQPRRVLGVAVGWEIPVTAVLFTLGHTIVNPQWWQFSIMAPALVFGWLRARTRNVVASTLFHASCNILMVVLDTMYGVIK